MSITAVLNCCMRNCLVEAESLDMSGLGIFGLVWCLLLLINGFFSTNLLVKYEHVYLYSKNIFVSQNTRLS